MNKQMIKMMIGAIMPTIKQKINENGGSVKIDSEKMEELFNELGLKTTVILNDDKMEITLNE